MVLGGLSLPTWGTDDVGHNSYQGKAAPELKSEKSHWVNKNEVIKLGDLKGKLVWLQFNF
jgi:hypothetical protein